jgi:predicted methyltransferase MtxX (methanogen marker protein 4)
MDGIEGLWQRIEAYAASARPRIAIGLKAADPRVVESLERARSYAEIAIVCPEQVMPQPGFETIAVAEPEQRLADMLVDGEVDGIVRGTIDAGTVLRAYKARTGETSTTCPALLEDPRGRQFYLCPVSNPNGWSREERLDEAAETAGLLRDWGVMPSIAVYTGIRRETYDATSKDAVGIKRKLADTFDDANWIVEQLRSAGFSAENAEINLNTAIEAGHNLHVPVNGMVGNQIFRTLVFCGGRMLTTTRFGLSRPYEDNSRSEIDFEPHVKWLVALINRRARP